MIATVADVVTQDETVLPSSPQGSTGGTGTRTRLAHIDAMRPVKQAGVVSTHAILMFAPAGTALAAGAALTLLHVTREAFLFVSACMLTYSCRSWQIDWRNFYRRRLTLVALPYVTWTLIYWVFTWHHIVGAWTLHVGHLGYLLATGYYQLYYLVVLLQFYLLFPLLLTLVRKVRNHVVLLVASLAAQVAWVSLMHWNLLPSPLRDYWASREVTSYQFYLLVGMVVALHLAEVHDWLCRHAVAVVVFTLGGVALAEAWYFLATDTWHWLGSNSDPFQPIVIPFNIGMIAVIYLVGVWLADERRSAALAAAVRSGSDNAYGVFLAQMIFLTILVWLGWGRLHTVVWWPLVCAGGVVLVFCLCVTLSALLARTPLARALTGRARVPLRRPVTRPDTPSPMNGANASIVLPGLTPAAERS